MYPFARLTAATVGYAQEFRPNVTLRSCAVRQYSQLEVRVLSLSNGYRLMALDPKCDIRLDVQWLSLTFGNLNTERDDIPSDVILIVR